MQSPSNPNRAASPAWRQEEAIARIRKEYGALIRSLGAGHINDGGKENEL